MVMPQSVVPKAAYPAEYRQALAKGAGISESSIRNIQGHNLGFEAIRQLPEKMKNPVAILKSDTKDGSVVVLTDMVDAYKLSPSPKSGQKYSTKNRIKTCLQKQQLHAAETNFRS